jgi:Flp pilus assembly protein TadG
MRFVIKRFLRDEQAVFGILLGILMLPLTMMALMGIEYFRLVEFRDKLESVASQVAIAAAAGKPRSETQRLAEGRALLSRVMAEQKLNTIGNSGVLTVMVRGDSVTSKVKLEARYQYEFGVLLRQQDTKLAVERTIKVRKPKPGGFDTPPADGNPGGGEEGVVDPENSWSY